PMPAQADQGAPILASRGAEQFEGGDELGRQACSKLIERWWYLIEGRLDVHAPGGRELHDQFEGWGPLDVHVEAGPGSRARRPRRSDPPQTAPVLLVPVDEHLDPRVRADVGEPLQRLGAFRFAVDRPVEGPTADREYEGDDVRGSVRADGGQDAHGRVGKQS